MSRITRSTVGRMYLTALAATMAAAGALAEPPAEKPVKVFILAGQSNMEGKALIEAIEYQATKGKKTERYKHMMKDGKWVVRDDVWISFLERKGNLTVGFGSPGRVGPEYEFGNVVGDHLDEKILIIKTAWGGKSLFRDFRPPSSGPASDEHLQAQLERYKKKDPDTTMEIVKGRYGMFYRKMLEEVADNLDNLKKYFPDYKGQGYEIAGFVWFQGFNDKINKEYSAAYEGHMVNFIRDVRKDLKRPNLPFVLGQVGFGGEANAADVVRAAQAAAAARPEFKGNVKLVPTAPFWDKEADEFGKQFKPPKTGTKEEKKKYMEWWFAERLKHGRSEQGYHYLGSPWTFCEMGRAFGEGMIELMKK